MTQAEVFLSGEGDKWLQRNRNRLPVLDDPVLMALRDNPSIRPQCVLEIGCSNGWRLEEIKEAYGCQIFGVEPSALACADARQRRVPVFQTTATNLRVISNTFDLVIFGFCLYLADREDLFQIAAEADRVLRDGGYVLIYDFFATQPKKVKYKHDERLWSYHWDYSNLFLANPAYKAVYSAVSPNSETSVDILRKSVHSAWPEAE